MTYICMDDGGHEDRNNEMSTCCSLCEHWHAISPCHARHKVGRHGTDNFRTCEVGKPCTPCPDFIWRKPRPDSILFNGSMRTFLRYLVNEGAEEYIESALRAYDLVIHEFGPDVTCHFSMNYYDYCCPYLAVDFATMPKELQDSHMEKIDKINATLRSLFPHTYAKTTQVMMG